MGMVMSSVRLTQCGWRGDPSVIGGDDCDDDVFISPGFVESCDGIDNNCNGVDEGLLNILTTMVMVMELVIRMLRYNPVSCQGVCHNWNDCNDGNANGILVPLARAVLTMTAMVRRMKIYKMCIIWTMMVMDLEIQRKYKFMLSAIWICVEH